MKCLLSSPGNLAASYMTSGDSSLSKYCSLDMDALKMESNSCVTAISDNGLRESDACCITSTNGCLKNTMINDSTSGTGCISNNNSGVVGEFSTASDHFNDIKCDHIGSQMTTDLNGSCTSPVFLSTNGNTCCPNHCEQNRFPSDVCISNGPAASVGELSSALSTMVLSAEESSRVPSDEMPINGSKCGSSIQYIVYESERQMGDIMKLITKDLSEPYSIYTYRYFIHNWPRLCYLAMDGDKCIGAIVCKLDRHRSAARRGYIAMLAIDQDYRKAGIGSNLVVHAIESMTDPASGGCDEVVLETEISNSAALRLYEKLGFVRDKRLFRYYLNGVDALRLKLWLK